MSSGQCSPVTVFLRHLSAACRAGVAGGRLRGVVLSESSVRDIEAASPNLRGQKYFGIARPDPDWAVSISGPMSHPLLDWLLIWYFSQQALAKLPQIISLTHNRLNPRCYGILSSPCGSFTPPRHRRRCARRRTAPVERTGTECVSTHTTMTTMTTRTRKA